MDLERLFEKGELIPAIVQQAGTNEVLMLAYMNRESQALTLETGYTCFFSRSRGRLWKRARLRAMCSGYCRLSPTATLTPCSSLSNRRAPPVTRETTLVFSIR